MIWITSDHHFCHTNCIAFCNRPFSNVNEMNRVMIEKWNEKVKQEDNVIHLGDFFLANKTSTYLHILQQLNGKIFLIRGNHDRKSNSWYKNRFGFIDSEDFTIKDKIFFSHYPLVLHSKQTKRESERIKLLKEAYDLSGCQYVFHGHSHNSPVKDYPTNHYNVGVDLHNFYPIDLKEKIKELNWL